MSETLDGWTTVRGLAKRWKKSPATIYVYIGRGLPVNDRLGRAMIHVETAEKWLLDGLRSKNQRGDAHHATR